MTKPKKKLDERRPIRLMFYGLAILVLILAILMLGTEVSVLNPKGLIAGEQRNLILLSTIILLLIAVPTLFFFYFFAWKYRESNHKAAYESETHYGKLFAFGAWAIPSVFMVILGAIMWTSTYKLEPKKALISDTKPITVQVVAMRWKWLFIYPEEKIATVNFVQIPTDTPIRFELTADNVSMSSFWIPHLGGMLYAMTGHVNPLNLMAEEEGDYPGSNAEINGPGFAGMKFTARASSQAAYDDWVQDILVKSDGLDEAAYNKLLIPSQNNQAAYYNLADPDLYDKVVMKYGDSHQHKKTETETPDNASHAEHE